MPEMYVKVLVFLYKREVCAHESSEYYNATRKKCTSAQVEL